MKEKELKNTGVNMNCRYNDKCRNREYQGLIDYIDDVRNKCSDIVYNITIENNTTGTKYIVEYAPIINNGYSKQDIETMIIISDLTKDEVAETIRSNFNKANVDKPWFNGIYLTVQTVDEFLNTIPTYNL